MNNNILKAGSAYTQHAGAASAGQITYRWLCHGSLSLAHVLTKSTRLLPIDGCYWDRMELLEGAGSLVGRKEHPEMQQNFTLRNGQARETKWPPEGQDN